MGGVVREVIFEGMQRGRIHFLVDWEGGASPNWLRDDDGRLEQAKLDEWEEKKDAFDELNRKGKEKRVRSQKL